MQLQTSTDNPFVNDRATSRGASGCYAVLSLSELEALAALAREKITESRGSYSGDACVIIYSLATRMGETLQISSSNLGMRVAGQGRKDTFAVPSGRRI